MLIGNSDIQNYLSVMVNKKAIAHALLFSGPAGVGKGLFANWFAEKILGSTPHPDLFHLHPEGKLALHNIDALRAFSDQVYLAPYEAEKKVFILHDAERMQPAAANALLKTLEEPAPSAVIILTSSHPERMLPTIRSRCRQFPFQRVGTEEIASFLQQKGVEREKAELLAQRGDGSVAKALACREKNDEIGMRLTDFLSKGELRNYSSIVAFASFLAKEESMVDEAPIPSDLSAAQKEGVVKEREAQASLIRRQLCEEVLLTTLSWFRQKCFTSPTLENQRMLEDVQRIIKQAKLSHERSTALHLVFETFFLSLQDVA